jgi:FkbM family methyltransferase
MLVRRVGRQRAFWRRLPGELGGERFRASTEGGLKFLRRRFWLAETDLSRFARNYVRPGATVWDVGANVGFFAFAAAGLAGSSGRVVAVEPDAWLVTQLRRSAGRLSAQAAPVDVVPCAISDRVGIAHFQVASSSLAASHLATTSGSPVAGAPRRTDSVASLTLDVLLDHLPPPNVLKIDVELAELDVLRGGETLLREHRPILLIEVGSETASDVTSLLQAAGYDLRNAQDGSRVQQATWSTLALPRSGE